jgi:RND family efflux transporter MFP subunit
MKAPGFLAIASGVLLIAALATVLSTRAALPGVPQANPAPIVTVVAAERAQWPVALDATGAIAPWHEAIVGAQVAGLRLTEVHANVGDVVKRGQLLARFDAEMLRAEKAQLEAALAQAEATASQAEANRQRALQLQDSGGISGQEVLQHLTQAKIAQAQVAAARAQLASKQLQLRQADVVAPDDGEISARSAAQGAVGAGGQELFRIIRQHRLEWRGELTAAQITQVAVGQRLQLDLPDGQVADAQVRRIAPSLESGSRLGLIYADIEPGSSARAGMYAGGRIVLAQTGAVVVPAASVVIRDGRSYVFKLQADGGTLRAMAQPVTVGRRNAARTEIVRNLGVGEHIVLQGAGFLNDGDPVRIDPPPPMPPASKPAAPEGKR